MNTALLNRLRQSWLYTAFLGLGLWFVAWKRA